MQLAVPTYIPVSGMNYVNKFEFYQLQNQQFKWKFILLEIWSAAAVYYVEWYNGHLVRFWRQLIEALDVLVQTIWKKSKE